MGTHPLAPTARVARPVLQVSPSIEGALNGRRGHGSADSCFVTSTSWECGPTVKDYTCGLDDRQLTQLTAIQIQPTPAMGATRLGIAAGSGSRTNEATRIWQ